jgi:subtilisin family serine protease
VKIGSSVIFDPGTYTNPDFEDLESRAYSDGARISSNSWGAAVGGAYNADAQRYDALVRDAQPASAVIPAAGKPGNDHRVRCWKQRPERQYGRLAWYGKNVITVGAAENVNPFGGADGCNTTDAQADNANDIVPFSSRGPTDDGRVKPDIQAPGTHISGGVAQASMAAPAGSGTGTANPCFNANGVCAGPGGSDFFPLGQQYYTASSGTSHSCPAVAGVAALIRQHFTNQSLPPPSPAMTKALMLNSTRYMTGVGANDNLPSNNQASAKSASTTTSTRSPSERAPRSAGGR